MMRGPAQVIFHRADRAAARRRIRPPPPLSATVSKILAAVHEARIDDLHRGYHVFGRGSTSVSPDPGPSRAFRE